jgi:hypothetical protein
MRYRLISWDSSRRAWMPSRIVRAESAERLKRPRRSPSIAAIGASSFGGLLETVWPRR